MSYTYFKDKDGDYWRWNHDRTAGQVYEFTNVTPSWEKVVVRKDAATDFEESRTWYDLKVTTEEEFFLEIL
jgi:hypothetical protein